MGDSEGGVAFMHKRRGFCVLVGQIFFERVVLDGVSAAVLQSVIEGHEVGLRDGDGGCRSFSGREWDGQIGIVNGNGKWERRQDGGELFGGLLWSVDCAFLRLNGGESGGE